MRENINTNKRSGDPLSAKHVNQLSRGARQFSHTWFGSGQNAISATFNGNVALPTPGFDIVEVTLKLPVVQHQYRVKRRYYDHENEQWTLVNKTAMPMDASEVRGGFLVGDKLPAFWHTQRKAFIPLTSGSTILRIGKTERDLIAPVDTGPVRLWRDGVETGDTLDDVYYDWITNDQDLPEDTEVIVGWFPEEGDEGIWRIIGAACSPSP